MFTVIRQVDGPDHGPLGMLWRPKYFTWTGIAVHGYTSVPPYPASHGCARVSNDAMNWIWANNIMPIGTTVWVYSESRRVTRIVRPVTDGVVVPCTCCRGRAGPRSSAARRRVEDPRRRPARRRPGDRGRPVAVADALGVAAAAVTLVGGERSRLKRFRVDGLDAPKRPSAALADRRRTG